ncbi:MAG: transposase [Candidatus Omnitrophica bacterium]|nr:transposase [Candidatus Omnitrophota bacterium]MBU4477971.1 transposase [Candidatus Omnitrophota bacterium]MCG2704329.1 transposase [Candidatus Omnitrophota bacterium]
MPRQGRIDYPGALQHIIGRGIERRAIFKEEADKSLFLKIIKGQLSKSSVQIYAWSIMDNHFHILLQTGKTGLSEFMRRILTGYAVNYNKIYNRTGHLFQNRYKSILCDKDEYLLRLIRYIHLNPVKAGVIDINSLYRYDWTGHREILKKQEEGIIVREEVLGYFEKTGQKAIALYKEYIYEGLELKEDYEGGGLIRSAGGISEAIKRRPEDREMYDDRILGDGDFVDKVYNAIDEGFNYKIKDIEALIMKIAKYYRVKEGEIIETRKKEIREARNVLVYAATKYFGESGKSIGKKLGIGIAAASIAREKGRQICIEKKDILESIIK